MMFIDTNLDQQHLDFSEMGLDANYTIDELVEAKHERELIRGDIVGWTARREQLKAAKVQHLENYTWTKSRNSLFNHNISHVREQLNDAYEQLRDLDQTINKINSEVA